MTVRHITAVGNVDDDGYLVDPSLVHHGSIQGGRIGSLAGLVDPATHLNREFPEHEIGECVIAAELAVGAAVVMDDDGILVRAVPRHDVMSDLGHVDQGARRTEWLQVLRDRRSQFQ